jgi:hypothetical protein
MDVCVRVRFVIVLFCVQVSALRRADPPPKGFYMIKKLKRLPRSNRKTVESQTNRQALRDRQTDRQAHRQTDNRYIGRQADRQTNG